MVVFGMIAVKPLCGDWPEGAPEAQGRDIGVGHGQSAYFPMVEYGEVRVDGFVIQPFAWPQCAEGVVM